MISYREQLSVIPAYALTVHRSQGLSLDNVAIYFSKTVVDKWAPYGMVYVALSRCRSMSGLWIRGLKERHIRVSPTARRLMSQIAHVMLFADQRIVTSPNMAMALVACLEIGSDPSDSEDELFLRETAAKSSRIE